MASKTYSTTIFGKCASKANSRKLAIVNGRRVFIKSKSALQFLSDARKQLTKKPFLNGDLELECTIWYPDRRSDVDESLVMDILQGVWFENDRQIRNKIVRGRVSRSNPRVEVTVREIDPPDEEP